MRSQVKFTLYRSLEDQISQPPKGGVWAIGNFDGVHIGHQQIIREAKRLAEIAAAPSGVVTFEPHPREFFAKPGSPPFRLTRPSDKIRQLAEAGAENCLCIKFTKPFSELTAEAFIEKYLVERLAVRHVVIGDDFHFGKNRGGSYDLLQKKGEEHGFGVTALSAQTSPSGKRFSSGALRAALVKGDVREYRQLSGGCYSISGRVRKGNQKGRMLNFPTANLNFYDRLVTPAFGVYAVAVSGVTEQKTPAVANFGVRPTAEAGRVKPLLEIHIPNFSGNLYDKKITAEFIDFIRPEKKFSNLNELSVQIRQDTEQALQICEKCFSPPLPTRL